MGNKANNSAIDKEDKRKNVVKSLERCKCTVEGCGKEFSKRSNLKAHMRVHSNILDFACFFPSCQKRFRWKSSLKPHVRWHLLCGDTFPFPTSIEQVSNEENSEDFQEGKHAQNRNGLYFNNSSSETTSIDSINESVVESSQTKGLGNSADLSRKEHLTDKNKKTSSIVTTIIDTMDDACKQIDEKLSYYGGSDPAANIANKPSGIISKVDYNGLEDSHAIQLNELKDIRIATVDTFWSEYGGIPDPVDICIN